jgi:hypothetical protein
MAMSGASKNHLMKLLLQNIAWPNLGDASGLQPSGAAGNLYIALHSANPTAAAGGVQTTDEIAYTGYGRVAVVRSAVGFNVVNEVGSNAAAVAFLECTAGSANATHFSVGVAETGAGEIVYAGPLGSPRSISGGITPIFNAGTLSGTAT